MSYSVICPSCHEKNAGNFLACQKCQTSLIGIPREEFPPSQSNPPKQITPQQNQIKPLDESFTARRVSLLAKTFGIACVIGIIVSTIGWNFLDWNSSRQFSDGFFWTSAVSAILGFYAYRSELRARHNLNALYAQSAGNMDILARTKRWIADAESNYRVVFYFFLITVYLFGFSVLIWNIF